MKIDDLTIGEARQLANMLNPAKNEAIESFGSAIVVADRGHVWHGNRVVTDSKWCTIDGARAIRIWGTSRGLNELADAGPLSGTKLDAPADLRVNMRAVIAIIPTKKPW